MDLADSWLVDGKDDAPFTFVLAHGAGTAMGTPFMNTIAGGLTGRGLRVIRFEEDKNIRRTLAKEVRRLSGRSREQEKRRRGYGRHN